MKSKTAFIIGSLLRLGMISEAAVLHAALRSWMDGKLGENTLLAITRLCVLEIEHKLPLI